MSTTAALLTNVLDLLGLGTRKPVSKEKFQAVYADFARRNPGWEAALFDEHFLNSALQRKGRKDDGHLTPRGVAEAWADQLHWGDQATRAARIAEAVPVAAEFLRLIDEPA